MQSHAPATRSAMTLLEFLVNVAKTLCKLCTYLFKSDELVSHDKTVPARRLLLRNFSGFRSPPSMAVRSNNALKYPAKGANNF